MGRPRCEQTEAAVLRAAVEVFVEEGYEGMSVERVATRAGVGRATIYRRWPTKADLVVAGLSAWAFEKIPEPRTDDARADFELLLDRIINHMAAESPVVHTLLVEEARNPELSAAVRRTFLPERRAALRRVLRRGIDAGQFPEDTDVELVADAGPAMAWAYLTRLREKPPKNLAARVTRQFVPLPTPRQPQALRSDPSRSARRAG